MSTYILCHSGTELYHHGIIGQRWGVRRYQNKDGSYTPEGIIRYERKNDKYNKKINRLSKKAARLSKKETKLIKKLNNGEGTLFMSPAKVGKKAHRLSKKQTRLNNKTKKLNKRIIRNKKYIDYMTKQNHKINPSLDWELNDRRRYLSQPLSKRIKENLETTYAIYNYGRDHKDAIYVAPGVWAIPPKKETVSKRDTKSSSEIETERKKLRKMVSKKKLDEIYSDADHLLGGDTVGREELIDDLIRDEIEMKRLRNNK